MSSNCALTILAVFLAFSPLLSSPHFVSENENGASLRKTLNWTLDYDNRLAEFAMDFAAAAYAPDPGPCLTRHSARLEMRAQVPCDALRDECWAFIAVNSQFLVFSIRGTRTNMQLVVELIETMTAPKKSFAGGGSVQHYFFQTLQALWTAGFGEKLKELKATHPGLPVLFTGHSLGGAIASLASTQFAWENNQTIKSDQILLVTFGQPRVGNMDYARSHDRLVPNSFRVVHRYDIVAHLPYCYERLFTPHRCIPLHNHGPFHHGTEIWFPSDEMNANQSLFRVCDGSPYGEDDGCSNAHYVHFQIRDHLFYFGKNVDSYGILGCINPFKPAKMSGRKRKIGRRKYRKWNITF